LEPHDLPKVSHKERDAYDVATVAEIDRTVKKYADNLLDTLEGVSSRLSQLESRTRHLESSVDDLKDAIGNNSGSTDGKLRQLENILREVCFLRHLVRRINLSGFLCFLSFILSILLEVPYFQ